MIQDKYSAQYFVKWLFAQDEWWLDAKGNWHAIAEMPKPHAFNACVYLQRCVTDVYLARFPKSCAPYSEMSEWLIKTPTFKALKARATSEGPSYF